MSKCSWHLCDLGSLQGDSSHVSEEMLSLFTMHREPQGPVTSTRSRCSSPRSKTTVAENAATLPKLSPQLQMLHTGCTDIPAQRALSPTPDALCATLLVLLLLLPIQQPLGDAANTSPFADPHLTAFPSHTCDTLFPLQILTVTFSHTETKERQRCSQDLTPAFDFLITDAETLWRKCYFSSMTVSVSFHFRLANNLNYLWPLSSIKKLWSTPWIYSLFQEQSFRSVS